MSGACDNFILEDQSCEWFELVQYVESFDMGINFLEGPPGPPGPAGEAIFIPSVSEDGWISWTNTAGLPNPDPVYIKGPPGGGGSGDYDDLTDKPSINGVTLSGNKTTAELLIRFSATDVGLGNVANERQYSAQNPPPYPVKSVNGQTGDVQVSGISALDVYPIGSIYMSVNSVSPATLFGGTWEQIEDTFLLAAGTNYAAGSTGGEATHTLTGGELPKTSGEWWMRRMSWGTDSTQSSAIFGGTSGIASSDTGSGGSDSVAYYSGVSRTPDRIKLAFGNDEAHNNMPPYLAVYMWKRTA